MIKASELNKYTTIVPLGASSLEDLRPYGALGMEVFQKHLTNSNAPFSLKHIQESEKDNYDSDPWNYHINSYNFRDEWDFQSKKPRIGFFGCSFTFGEGIQSENTFVKIVSNTLNLNSFNFGSGGSSVERVARTFSAVTKLIDLDIAIITLPSWYRQLHIGKEGNMINIIPGYPHSGYEKICKMLTDVEEEFYVVRATSSINWIHDASLNKGIKILFSSWDHPLNYFCKRILPENTLEPFPNIDDKKARDNMHPGIKSQRAHADQIIKAINDRSWI